MSKSSEIRALIEATGKYAVVEEFQEGVNGYAFRARNKHLEREVFLKVIDADPESSKTFEEPRALVDALAGGDCENLVRLHDTERLTSELILMSMEFVEGGSLNALIEGRSLGQMDAVQLAMGVLVGVGRLHTARFLHRDIKPGNLLIKPTGTSRTAKLGDFGSVRRLATGEDKVAASRHSALYRPAEAWGGLGWFTFSSDLYQLGVCLHEMVNGPLPYTFESYVDAQSKITMRKRGVSSLSELDPFERSQVADGCLERRIKGGRLLELAPTQPFASPRLARIIRKATAVDAADRFQGAYEFRNALQCLAAPNWKVTQAGVIAESWRGWDWKTRLDNSGPVTAWKVMRARPGTNAYRAFGGTHGSSKLAYRAIEDFS
jgi:serine/threonine protein kinase